MKAQSLQKHNHNQDALDYYNKALRLNPSNHKTWFSRGCFYDQIQNYEAAIDDYEQALKKCPHFATGFFHKGMAESKIGKLEDALNSFNLAIQLEPNSEFYHNRGMTYRMVGDLERAVKDFTVALQLNSKFAEARLNRALCYEELQRTDYALDDMVRCLHQSPDNLELILNVSLLEVKCGPKYFESAIPKFQK